MVLAAWRLEPKADWLLAREQNFQVKSPTFFRPLLGGLLMLVACAGANSEPFRTRDQNPFLAGFGLPVAMPSSIAANGKWQWAADFNWGSSANVQANASEALIVDAETRELRVRIGRGLGNGFAMQLQIPYRYTGGGTLDGFIDDWHGWFSLPEGARRTLPKDQYRIAYQQGATLMDLRRPSSGLADISADVGYQLQAGDTTHLAAWLSLELPTGDADELTGNEAIDASLILAGARSFAERWTVFGQVAASYLGEGDLLGRQQRSFVLSGMAGLEVAVTANLGLKAQLDTHGGAFAQTSLDYLNDTAILTVGGSYHFNNAWQLDIGVSEDIVVDGGPDVVFVLGLRRAR